MKYKLCTKEIIQNASERGGCYKLSMWRFPSVVHPLEYGAYCFIFQEKKIIY